MDSKLEIEKIVETLQKRKGYLEGELLYCEKGTLSYETRNKEQHLVKVTHDKKGRHRHSLANDENLATSLLRRRILEDELKVVKNNLAITKAVVYKYEGYNTLAELQRLKKELPCITSNVMRNSLLPHSTSNWEAEPYNKSDYYPEALRHMTSRGLKVRSKSEVLIAEKLYENNVAFRYEQVIHIGNVSYSPDFTIKRADGKIIYWEHMGCTNNQDYINRQLNKLRAYATVEIVPWDNLILTYDDSYGNIDIRIIESEILNKLIV